MALNKVGPILQSLQETTIPPTLHNGIAMYIAERCKAGDFLMSVFRNDLFQACARADLWSRASLAELCSWIYSNAPSACHGDSQRVYYWLNPDEEKKDAEKNTG